MSPCSINLVGFYLSFLLFSAANAAAAAAADGTFHLKKYGAVPDGKTDSTKALEHAWADACAAEGRPQLVIPPGDFLVGPVLFKGRCKGEVTIHLDGNLLADTNLGRYKSTTWLDFQYLDGLTIKGRGTLNGQGESAWPHNQCPKKWTCKLLPTTMALSFVTNASIKGITSLNSKFFHFSIFASQNVDIRWLTITAPGDSPNTDGIHLSNSKNVSISASRIGTGDDCISIGSGTSNVTVSGVTCGPGHGLSTGSLGKGMDKGDVVGLRVKNCTIFDTTNGIRIKTWGAKPNAATNAVSLTVSDFEFDNIVMHNVFNPIIIDQHYCPYHSCPETEPSRVKITGVKFKNIRGTSATPKVVNLSCSKKNPCEGLELNNIHLEYTGGNPVLKTETSCENVKGKPGDCSLV